jgi:hypothetical protein
MPAKTAAKKVECLNPNTGGKINIDADIYDLFSKAIHHTLKKEKALTFTQLVDGVHECFKEKKVKFEGSVSWYAVTIKNDMEARGVIETLTEKGKKMHRLKK